MGAPLKEEKGSSKKERERERSKKREREREPREKEKRRKRETVLKPARLSVNFAWSFFVLVD